MRKALLFVFAALLFAISAKAQDTISVQCSEDYYQGDAQFSLTVDGKSVATGTTCTTRNPTTTPQVSTFSGTWSPASAHTVTVTFTNWASGGSAGTNRNLLIWSVSLDGTAASPAGTKTLYSNNPPAYVTYTTSVVNQPPPPPPPPPAPTVGASVSVACPAAHTVGLTWQETDTSVTAYNVYRSTTSGSAYAKLNASPIPTASYTDSPAPGATYFYVVTALNSSGQESSFSSQVSAVIPSP